MSTISHIESLTRTYAAARAKVAELVQELQTDIDFVRRKRIAAIKRAVATTADAHAALRAAVESSAELFVKPRSISVAGVKVGMQQSKERVEIDDEAAVIARIRALLPADQAALLIRVRETVDRNALVDLSEADLKRLSVRVDPAADQVLIKPTDTETDKLVSALLREAEQVQEQAA